MYRFNLFLILFLLIFTTVTGWCQSDIDDYLVLINGIKCHEDGKFENAIRNWKSILLKYPESPIVRSTLIYYYIGKSYIGLKDYEKALENLSKTKHFSQKVMLLKADINYLAGNKKTAEKLYKSLLQERFSKKGYELEKLAITKLVKIDKKYETYHDVKHLLKLKRFKSLKNDQIFQIGSYFMNTGQYSSALTLFEYLRKKRFEAFKKHFILKVLYYMKSYSRVISTGEKMLKTDRDNHLIHYYIALAYKKKGKNRKALNYFEKIEMPSLLNSVEFEKGSIHFKHKDYKKALATFMNTTNYRALKYVMKCLEKSFENKDIISRLGEMVESAPYNELTAQLRYELYTYTGNKEHLNEIIKYNPGTFYFKLAMEKVSNKFKLGKFPIDKYTEKYLFLMSRLEKLKKIDFVEGPKLEIDSTEFATKDRPFKKYLVTKTLEDEGKYGKAYRNSAMNTFTFAKFRETCMLLYPRYFKDSVEKYSKKHSIKTSLVYSLIMKESSFRQDTVSSSSAYGLMQLLVPTARIFDKKISFQKLLIPETNINLGIKYLKYLKKKFKGNLIHILAAYNGGEGNVRKWIKRFGKNFDIDQIPFYETRRYVKKVLSAMYMYSLLYKK